MTTPPPPTPDAPNWARARGGPPAPGTALDQQFSAFIGPRWERYRRKFSPFFDDPRFQPTWNWAAALTIPIGGLWFLYRKLYVPFVFFAVVPGLAFALLWGGDIPFESVPNPVDPAAPPINLPTAEARVVLAGVTLSALILAGGTANFLLFRRATVAMQLIAPRAPEPGAQLALLRRVGGVSWASVAVGLAISFLIQILSSVGGAGTR